jgi:hypothetical protein
MTSLPFWSLHKNPTKHWLLFVIYSEKLHQEKRDPSPEQLWGVLATRNRCIVGVFYSSETGVETSIEMVPFDALYRY